MSWAADLSVERRSALAMVLNIADPLLLTTFILPLNRDGDDAVEKRLSPLEYPPVMSLGLDAPWSTVPPFNNLASVGLSYGKYG